MNWGRCSDLGVGEHLLWACVFLPQKKEHLSPCGFWLTPRSFQKPLHMLLTLLSIKCTKQTIWIYLFSVSSQ